MNFCLNSSYPFSILSSSLSQIMGCFPALIIDRHENYIPLTVFLTGEEVNAFNMYFYTSSSIFSDLISQFQHTAAVDGFRNINLLDCRQHHMIRMSQCVRNRNKRGFCDPLGNVSGIQALVMIHKLRTHKASCGYFHKLLHSENDYVLLSDKRLFVTFSAQIAV